MHNLLSDIRERMWERPQLALLMAFFLYILTSATLQTAWMALLATAFGFSGSLMADVLSGSAFQLEGAANFLRVVLGGGQLLTWGLSAFLVARLLDDQAFRWLAWKSTSPLGILLAIACLIAAFPFMQFITFDPETFHLPEALSGIEASMKAAEASSERLLMNLLGDTKLSALILNILVFALAPAVCEELFFRAAIQGTLERMMKAHGAVWLTAFIFSLMHFQFYGFFSRMLLGAALGYFRMYSGSIIPSIAAHFSFNLLNILLAYTVFSLNLDQEMLDSSFRMPWGWILLSLVSMSLCFVAYIRLFSDQTSASNRQKERSSHR